MNTDELPILFKAQLFALTGVQPDRQKVMFKGKIVSDDSWQGFSLKEVSGLMNNVLRFTIFWLLSLFPQGAQLLMMGAADEIPQAPKDKVTFMEDMSESELATALDLPCGLTNLGNTCYLNATVQCLRTVPELRDALAKFTGHLTLSEHEGPQNLTVALRDLLVTMETQSTVVPVIMVQVLHLIFPRFAEKSEQGGFMQQDANECWTELLRVLQSKLPPLPPTSGSVCAGSVSSFVDQFFGGRYKVAMKNTECEDEAVSYSSEDFLQLSCFISQETRFMQSGIKSSLEEKITKHSPKLGTDAIYLKTCKIDRLPAYLAIQFVRFRYKEKASTNAKILKDIKFTINLDVFELCTPELQEKLTPMRQLFKEEEDRRALLSTKDKSKSGTKPPTTGNTAPENVTSESSSKKQPFSFSEDYGSNNSGFYTLQAVLTHLGRSSSSGHYVGWIKGKNNEWFKCDDENVSLVTEEEILKLSGGGKLSLTPFDLLCCDI